MDSSVTIRRGTADDIPIILHHRLGMMSEMGIGTAEEHVRYAGDFAPFVRQAMSDGMFHQWLAESASGEVVAGGAVYIVPWLGNPDDRLQKRAYIVNVFTEPAFRHQGIARALMLVMVGWCKSQGFRQVRLHASDMGRPLYASLGFTATHEMRFSFDA
jgi:GNAT superfamily N-acetyltransferase